MPPNANLKHEIQSHEGQLLRMILSTTSASHQSHLLQVSHSTKEARPNKHTQMQSTLLSTVLHYNQRDRIFQRPQTIYAN